MKSADRLHLRRDHRTDNKQELHHAYGRDRREVPQSVIAELRVDVREQRHLIAGREDHQRAVTLTALQRVQRQASAGAGAIVDDDRGRVALHVFREHTGDKVGRGPGREAHHDPGGAAHQIGSTGGRDEKSRERGGARQCSETATSWHAPSSLRCYPWLGEAVTVCSADYACFAGQ